MGGLQRIEKGTDGGFLIRSFRQFGVVLFRRMNYDTGNSIRVISLEVVAG